MLQVCLEHCSIDTFVNIHPDHHDHNKGRYEANFYCRGFKAFQTFQIISRISAFKKSFEDEGNDDDDDDDDDDNDDDDDIGKSTVMTDWEDTDIDSG